MTPEEFGVWLRTADDSEVLRVGQWAAVSQYAWLAAGANTDQAAAARDVACEIEVIASIWPDNIDNALRPPREIAVCRWIKWRLRNLMARVVCAFLVARTKFAQVA